MSKSPPHPGPRKDFPIRRLLEKLILGNMVFFGGLFLLFLIGVTFAQLIGGHVENLGDFAEVIQNGLEAFLEVVTGAPEFVCLIFVGGTVAGLIWYVIARQLETRNLKKRLGLLTKPCTSPKADVKSPQS